MHHITDAHDPREQVIEATLTADGEVQTIVCWEETGMPLGMISAVRLGGCASTCEDLADPIAGRERRGDASQARWSELHPPAAGLAANL